MTGPRIGWGPWLLGLAACSGSTPGPDLSTTGQGSSGPVQTSTTTAPTSDTGPSSTDSGGSSSDDGGTTGPAPGGKDCENLSCLPCGNGLGCAVHGTIEGTCCAEGDSLARLAPRLVGPELVDIETDGKLLVGCGGFGAVIADIEIPQTPTATDHATPRCQRIAFGPLLANDVRVVYLAHHGDTFVPPPMLSTYHVDADGIATEVDVIMDPGVLFEGVVYHGGALYVAAHGGGVRVYDVDEHGVPVLELVLQGFENATKLAAAGDRVYVADGTGGLHVLAVAAPLSPKMVGHAPVVGIARDVSVVGNRAYVALGGNGVDVFDVTIAHEPTLVDHFDPNGSVQAISATEDTIAVAAWTHVAVYDSTTFQLLGTEQVVPSEEFEQDLGIATFDDIVVVAEWEGIHVLKHRPGMVAPDIWIEGDILNFAADEKDDAVVVVRNRGYLDLEVTDIDPGSVPAFSVDASRLFVPPGEARAFEVLYDPAQGGAASVVSLDSNDVDATQNPMNLHVSAQATDLFIDVGDPITDHWGFLDPNGLGQVEGLEGHVVVLAYFALF